ncbi:cyclophilin-like protein [Pholiota molesta]|nr:cyclophilin-like protein [Pholiota molesta]
MALPTNGKVILDTTVGEIEIDLWSKEAPKATRNFLALSMEGLILRRGHLSSRCAWVSCTTGDRTGTGGGGESFYGEPFEDEIHPRLRFPHRGIVAMANNGTKNSNDSQFFITLDRADELHGKHTVFGRCVGDTVYNVMKIGEMELDADGRPVYPPKIKSVRIVDNPFDDIVPRITAAEKRAQQRAKEQAQREREEEQRKRGAKKNVKLLSFGADEDAGEVVEPAQKVVAVRISSRSQVPAVVQTSRGPGRTNQAKKKEEDITKIREQHAREQSASEHSRKAEIEKMEAEIRKLQKRRDGPDSDDEAARKKPKKSYLGEELAKYAGSRGIHKKGRKRDEGDVLAALSSFRGKLQGTMSVDAPEDADKAEAPGEGPEGVAEEGMEGNQEEVDKAERDYEVIDPRARGAKAREEERDRKKAAIKAKGGTVSGGRYRRQ